MVIMTQSGYWEECSNCITKDSDGQFKEPSGGVPAGVVVVAIDGRGSPVHAALSLGNGWYNSKPGFRPNNKKVELEQVVEDSGTHAYYGPGKIVIAKFKCFKPK